MRKLYSYITMLLIFMGLFLIICQLISDNPGTVKLYDSESGYELYADSPLIFSYYIPEGKQVFIEFDLDDTSWQYFDMPKSCNLSVYDNKNYETKTNPILYKHIDSKGIYAESFVSSKSDIHWLVLEPSGNGLLKISNFEIYYTNSAQSILFYIAGITIISLGLFLLLIDLFRKKR